MTQTDVDAGALAKELINVRKRSLAEIDLRTSAQQRLELPTLEALARHHTRTPGLLRIELIRRLLRDGLAAYRRAGYAADADLLVDLFFDDGVGDRISHQAAGVLLKQAKDTHGATNFVRRRQHRIYEFADFLIEFVQVPVDQASAPIPSSTPASPSEQHLEPAVVEPSPRRRWLTKGNVFITVCLLYVGGFVAIDGIGQLIHKDPFGLNPAKKVPSPPSQSAAITFDDLGGDAGLVKTYPGVQKTPVDEALNGAFKTGASATVTCKLTGRNVSSDNDHGEHPSQSNVWLKLRTTSGPQQYVSTVYADISDSALSALDTCSARP